MRLTDKTSGSLFSYVDLCDPHVARKSFYSAIDWRTTRHAGYDLSQKYRKKIEEGVGWAKTVGGMT
jgi:hypothetical protein